jgi:hypothetical protein
MNVVEGVLAGEIAAGARLIRWLEDADERGRDALRALYRRTGRAHLVGVTGPPGVGKSTLVDALVVECRRRGCKVGVIAVDPTSPFSGGAILGDRVRMQRHATDPGVFIRSMASRGELGGLARATYDAALVMDAMGYDPVIIESEMGTHPDLVPDPSVDAYAFPHNETVTGVMMDVLRPDADGLVLVDAKAAARRTKPARADAAPARLPPEAVVRRCSRRCEPW